MRGEAAPQAGVLTGGAGLDLDFFLGSSLVQGGPSAIGTHAGSIFSRSFHFLPVANGAQCAGAIVMCVVFLDWLIREASLSSVSL